MDTDNRGDIADEAYKEGYARGVTDTKARLVERVLWQSCTRRGCGTTYSDGSARYCTACVQEMIAKTEARYRALVEACEQEHGAKDFEPECPICCELKSIRALDAPKEGRGCSCGIYPHQDNCELVKAIRARFGLDTERKP